jgi:hypothetical protein
MERIETSRRTRRRAVGPRRRLTWLWVLLVAGVNLGLSMSFVLMAEHRLAEVDHRMELADGEPWREELATVNTMMANLQGEVTKLREQAGDLAALRSGLETLDGQVDRIESRISILWHSPKNGSSGELAELDRR